MTICRIKHIIKEGNKIYSVTFFKLNSGKVPAITFLDSLPAKRRAKILKILVELEKLGPALREPYSKPLKNGLFEIRSQVGNNNDRLLYFFDKEKIIIITSGFIKKQQKTSANEIKRAEQYRAEYFGRRQKNE